MRNKGFSLIELLVAMAVSLLAILMLLMLFKQVTRLGMSSSQDAEYDANLETALLIVQKLVQNAGYGIGNDQDILRYRLVTTAENDSKDSNENTEVEDDEQYIEELVLLWRTAGADWKPADSAIFSDDGSEATEDEGNESESRASGSEEEDSNAGSNNDTAPLPNPQADSAQCWGIIENITTEENGQYLHQLQLIKRENCPLHGEYAGTKADWKIETIISSLNSKTGEAIFDYQVKGKCRPFGIRDLEGTQLTLRAKRLNVSNSDSTNNTALSTIERSQCLTNIISRE